MTALSTSVGLSLWPRGRQILLYAAVHQCMKEQYWIVQDS